MKIKTRKELLKHHDITCNEAKGIMVLRNTDYSEDTDPFKNLHSYGAYGILVHIGDKVNRIENTLEKMQREESFKEAVIKDSILDIINYSIILSGYLSTYGLKK